MSHNQFPTTSKAETESQGSQLSDEHQSYLDGILGKSLTVVRGVDTEEQRLEDGWTLKEDSVEFFEGSTTPYVTVIKPQEGSKRVRIDALMHYNPLEVPNHVAIEAHLPSIELIEQVGTEAVQEVVELEDAVVEDAEIAEETSEFIREAVLQTERLLLDLEESSRKDKIAINRVLEDLQLLSRRYMNAASEGPWSGNKIRDNYRLVRETQIVVGDAQGLVRKLRKSAEISGDYLNHSGRLMTAVEEKVLTKVAGTKEEKNAKEIYELLEDTARGITATEDTNEIELFSRRLANLENMVMSGYSETVDDARSELSQLIRKLEDVSEVVSRRKAKAGQGLSRAESLKR